MSTAEHVLVLSLGAEASPILEQLVSDEGFKVAKATGLKEGLSSFGQDSCSAVFLLASKPDSFQINTLLEEASSQLPSAKFLVSCKEGSPQALSEPLQKATAGRLLWLEGEPCASQNLEKIRRFLRGDGYSWARDLATSAGAGSSVLEATNGLPETDHERARRIRRFSTDLAHFTELQPMLQEALRRCLDILHCNAGSIYLWDENTETLILEAARGPEEEQRVGIRQKLGEGVAGWVAEVGEPLLITDVRKVEKFKRKVSNRYANFSCLAVPIKHAGQLVGVVCVTMPRDNQPLDAHDLALAQTLSEKLASAIRPLSVLSELRRFSEKLLGAFRSSSDIERRKDVQVESLRVLSDNILESVPVTVIAYDRNLRVRLSNRVARFLFGVETPVAGEQTLAPLENGIELDAKLWRSRLLGVIESGRKFRLQRVGYHYSSERKFVLDVHCSPLRNSEGETIGGILTIQDVTEDLETEAKLSSAERLALIGKLAAKVAHELNNPLDGILRFINLAIRQLDNREQALAYLEESRGGLIRMGNILSELLAFSRHYRKPSLAATSLTQVIHESIAPYEQRAKEADMKINLDVPPNLPSCPSADIWEVIGNVVKNSLDAVSQNGVITIHATAADGKVIITISDNGPGVPENLKEKIFEPFFTTKHANHGTGLGLALCRDSLRRIGGEIRLLPSEIGAAFELEIPIKPGQYSEQL